MMYKQFVQLLIYSLWTPNILLECYCVKKKKSIIYEKLNYKKQ